MANKKSKRGKPPSANTKRILWGKTAGICEFSGCDERLFYDDTTAFKFNSAYYAHIVSSDPNGPRGNKDSHKLSQDIDNLMLMCDKHHRMIDNDEEKYTVKILKEMKKEHEDRIDKIYSYLNSNKVKVINFSSPIRGNISVDIDYNKTARAVFPNHQPYDEFGIDIKIKSKKEYGSLEYWAEVIEEMKFEYTSKVLAWIQRVPEMNFAIFPLAPIPLLMKLGELFGDKNSVYVYQKTRDPDTWEWQSRANTNKFLIEKEDENEDGVDVILILSLTDYISKDRIPCEIAPKAVYTIKAKNKGVDCIKSELDLSEFWHKYQEVFDEILNKYGKDTIVHLFPAMPVSAAFEVGRRRMPVYPKTIVYEDVEGFKVALYLGE